MTRQQDKAPKVVIPLREVQDRIPRTRDGDPNFMELYPHDKTLSEPGQFPSLLDIFTEKQIVELVNRQLYQMEYQYNSHRQRYDEEKQMRADVKQALNELHPGVSLAKATEGQLRDAVNLVMERKAKEKKEEE